MSEPWSGYRRPRTVPRSVRRAEVVSRLFISLGGYGTILAVVTIFGYLLAVIAPLFARGDLESAGPALSIAATTSPAPIVRSGVDELGLLGWTLDAEGGFRVLRLADGSRVAESRLFGVRRPTAFAFAPGGTVFAAGFDDGTIQSGEVLADSRYVDWIDATEAQRALPVGAIGATEDGAFRITPRAQVRFQSVRAVVSEPARVGDGEVRAIDVGGLVKEGLRFAVLDASGHVRLVREALRENKVTGAITRRIQRIDVPHEPFASEPFGVFLDGIGGSLLIVAHDGTATRHDVRDGVDPIVAETLDLVPGDGRVTTAAWMNGKTTLVVGDDRGGVRAWFGTKPDGAETVDKVVFRCAHDLSSGAAAVRALHGSSRERMLAIAHADGAVRVVQITAENEIASIRTDPAVELESICLSPKDNEVVTFGRFHFQRFALGADASEVTLRTLFRPIWYEGAPGPAHVWQSTGGTDDFEPKLGMWPLVFGTIKSTLICILIAGPLALLAAVFTSEFLSPRARAPIKSVVEMMAGLPSVVLGFLGGLVLATFVQGHLASVLAAIFAVPFAFLLGARLWQFLPGDVAVRWESAPRVVAQVGVLVAGLALATVVGPGIERLAFGGDFAAWLAGGEGSAAVGFALLLLPLAVFAVVLVTTRLIGPALHASIAPLGRAMCAVVDLVRLLVSTAAALLLALAGGALLSGMGLDPRGGLLGTYSQRNALIVGFVMGFAVIPIIYTLAEDALSSVPRTLREGSLGAGATPWQTAWRITIPTAMSGLFSALMVGIGRAVGETMIVLMAAGSAPVMDWSLFEGFRTLSANLAIELPEAPKQGTHSRTLFLAAFLLFLMTFAINTVAELVRRTFRRRAAQL